MNILFPTSSSQKVGSIWSDDTTLADEGGYFVSSNPTVGTGIAQTICVDDAATASSTHAQFAPTALIVNNASTSDTNAPSIYPRYIKLLLTAAPASATAWYFSLRLDNLNRYASGGSALVPLNPNPNSSKGTKALVYFGAIVPTALPSSSSRQLGKGIMDSAIPVVGDQYIIDFGNSPTSNDLLSGGATPKSLSLHAPPIVIPPGWCLALDMWGPSNAATPASWEVEIGHVERVPGL